MSLPLLDAYLTTPAVERLLSDDALLRAMLRFEAALAQAQGEEGVIPAAAAEVIAATCNELTLDIAAIAQSARSAGSLAIPVVKALTRAVEARDASAAGFVHWGSTSQDVLDTALVLVSRDALAQIDADLSALMQSLCDLAERHTSTPVLARTLMQPAQVTSFGFKATQWCAPLLRSQLALRELARVSLALQLGGAVGTLAAMGPRGPAVAQRVAAALGLAAPSVSWHTQRDVWLRLGLEIAVLVGSLGKLATDLALLSQAEIGEVAEPTAVGRGGSSTMPHKRNPVSAMIALAAAQRAPQRAAALLAAMPQQQERGLGNWQAELAEWQGLLASALGAVSAMREAIGGLQVDAARMRANIDRLHGLVFAEAASFVLAQAIGRDRAFALMEALSRSAVQTGQPLQDLVLAEAARDSALSAVDRAALQAAFDPVAAAAPAAALARQQLTALRAQIETLPPAPWPAASSSN